MKKAWEWICEKFGMLVNFFKSGGIAYAAALILAIVGTSLLPETQIGGYAGVVIPPLLVLLSPIISFALIDNLLADWLRTKTREMKGALLALVCFLLLFLVIGANFRLTEYVGMVRIYLHLTSLVLMGLLTSLIVALVKALRH